MEELDIIKFYYKGWNGDKYPEVIVFDDKYPGKRGEKSYGEREDVLGWNLNYYGNKEEAIESINDINDFASLLSDNKEDRYKRVKKLFKDQAKLIRRYKKSGIKFMRKKSREGNWEKGEI